MQQRGGHTSLLPHIQTPPTTQHTRAQAVSQANVQKRTTIAHTTAAPAATPKRRDTGAFEPDADVLNVALARARIARARQCESSRRPPPRTATAAAHRRRHRAPPPPPRTAAAASHRHRRRASPTSFEAHRQASGAPRMPQPPCATPPLAAPALRGHSSLTALASSGVHALNRPDVGRCAHESGNHCPCTLVSSTRPPLSTTIRLERLWHHAA